ncbi:hypothetical protein MCOR31_008004 [Pyricularia oryzae]|nr:hypothetical protein MCOR31_008004 [Pyricularia oryzae]
MPLSQYPYAEHHLHSISLSTRLLRMPVPIGAPDLIKFALPQIDDVTRGSTKITMPTTKRVSFVSLPETNTPKDAADEVPTQHRALVFTSTATGLELKTVPTPRNPQLGTALVRVEAATILSYQGGIYNGTRQYPQIASPHSGGYSGVGRIAAVGADATTLRVGQFVFADCDVRARDGDGWFLVGTQTACDAGARRVNDEVYRDGAFAEYFTVPLENCHPLDEPRLTRELGYSLADVAYMSYLLVAYGGLRDVGLEPGETVVIAPATGGFGGAGVLTALAMGARVVAMGRSEQELARLRAHAAAGYPGRNDMVETVRITDDEAGIAAQLRALGTIDAVLDFSPPEAEGSCYLRCAIRSLRPKGRVSLMGFSTDFADHAVVMNSLCLRGKVMYERDDVSRFVKLLERGLFPRGKDFVDTKVFRLDQANEALDAAAEHAGCGRSVVFAP